MTLNEILVPRFNKAKHMKTSQTQQGVMIERSEDNPTSAKIREAFKLGKFEGKAEVKAQADKLAEALRGMLRRYQEKTGFYTEAGSNAREALAAYEAAQ